MVSHKSCVIRQINEEEVKSLPFLSSNGVRLFPPTTGGRLKSEAWKHGGFKKDNKGILLKETVSVLTVVLAQNTVALQLTYCTTLKKNMVI